LSNRRAGRAAVRCMYDGRRAECDGSAQVVRGGHPLCRPCERRGSSTEAPGGGVVWGLLVELREAHEEQARAAARVRDLAARTNAAGASWSLIGQALDVSRQAAQKRYGGGGR
jgi:hypothetical protein